jgi:hypothetical protein
VIAFVLWRLAAGGMLVIELSAVCWWRGWVEVRERSAVGFWRQIETLRAVMSLLRAASRNETQKNEQTNKRYRQTLQP